MPAEHVTHSAGTGPSRRGLLRAGAGLTAAGALGAAGVLAAAGPAAADLPVTPPFSLEGGGDQVFWRKPLHETSWAMQSFAYDNVNGHIYFAQHRPGDNENESDDGDPSKAHIHYGDIWIVRTDLAGNVLGTMALHQFGHGSSMAVEPTGAGSAPYLWIEGDNYNVAKGAYEDSGYRLTRFRYTEGITLTYGNPSVIPIQDRTPTITTYAGLPRPAIDPVNNMLLVRYATQSTSPNPWRLVVFPLADAVAGRLSQDDRKAERALPTNAQLKIPDDAAFQGVTLYGEYAYLLYGRSGGPSYLAAVSMNDAGGGHGEVFHTTAGATIPGREPQGCAIWVADGQPRLAFGFSGKTGTTTDPSFDASLFYKNTFA
ncbi:hypothetical protein ACIQCJ_22020 [Streptomyces sp. NPDC093221]|uniref:phage baseplate protein n=1 Tax=Streptomyces sp. NPDC093221 TaxID=3366032 RepID=UPI00382ADEBB